MGFCYKKECKILSRDFSSEKRAVSDTGGGVRGSGRAPEVPRTGQEVRKKMERGLHERDRVGVQDFVLLEDFRSEAAFIDNLRKRFKEDLIYVSRSIYGKIRICGTMLRNSEYISRNDNL